MTTRLLRPPLIDALSVAALLAAAALAAWPTRSEPAMPFAPPAAAWSTANSSAAALRGNAAGVNAQLSDSGTVVNANIFSGSRHVPRARYTSPDAMLAAASVPAPGMAAREGSDSAVPDTAAIDDAVPQLSGIVSQDGVRRALLRLSLTASVPQLMAEGDIRDGWQVVRIEADQVTLRPVRRGASALRILRLVPRSQRDSTGTKP